MRTSTAAVALLVATTSSVACTVLYDMGGYSGGLADTGDSSPDTGVKVDSAPPDSGAPKDSAADTNVADAADTSVVDSGAADTNAGDTTTPMDTSPPSDTSVADVGGSDAPLGCHVVVNEVQTAGAGASDEFVELFNPCDAVIDLNAYKVVYRSSAGSSDVLVATISAGKTIAAKGFFLLGNGTFASTADTPFGGIASLSATGGGVGVRDAAGTLLDSVGYGSVTNAFVEGTAAPAPASGASITRVPNGTDTNNNSVDFKSTASTPKS